LSNNSLEREREREKRREEKRREEKIIGSVDHEKKRERKRKKEKEKEMELSKVEVFFLRDGIGFREILIENLQGFFSKKEGKSEVKLGQKKKKKKK